MPSIAADLIAQWKAPKVCKPCALSKMQWSARFHLKNATTQMSRAREQ
jgi:hypothetical protein